MPWVGVEYGKKNLEEFSEIIVKMGLSVLGNIEIEVKTGRGWIKFIVLEVAGFVEGYAAELARLTQAPSLESGPHLIMGEPSAGFWEEAVKVVFPDGESEVIPVLSYDGFLDLKLPTENVRGIEGTITIGGKVFKLPLSLDDILEIYEMGKKAVEKVEKAASVYGIRRILSSEALLELSRAKRKPPKYEVDYEAGIALIKEEDKLRTTSVQALVLELAVKGFVDEAAKIYNEASPEVKEAIEEAVIEEYKVYSSIKSPKKAKLEELAKSINVELPAEEA